MAAVVRLAFWLGAWLLAPSPKWHNIDVLDYIDPLIGTAKAGHVFAGPSLPYAMAKPVADVLENNRGGFAPDGEKVSGYSHMHDDGIGGGSSMGFFPLFPMPGCAGNTPNGCAPFGKRARALPWKNGSVQASPGYFSIELTNNVRAEMTSTNHTALYRFTFPSTLPDNTTFPYPLILVDLTDLYDSRSRGHIQVNHTTGRISGSGTFKSSFGDDPYNAYFCADFEGAPLISTGTWQGDATAPNGDNTTMGGSYQDFGAYAQFFRPMQDNSILARVGLSFIDSSQACSNAEREIPVIQNSFETVVDAQRTAWTEKLSVVKINPGHANLELQTIFWSGIYRNMLSPQNYTGENPLWNSTEPYFDSWYCIWDSFRAQNPLLTVIDPHTQTEMVRNLVDIYANAGYYPDCRMALNKGITQGGSNADVLIADAIVKGITENINWTTAYEGLVKDAEVQPNRWFVEGRGHLESYKTLGYIPQDDVPSGYGLRGAQISRTVEYAYDDFCIATVARMLNKTEDYEKYIQRGGNWANLYREDQNSTWPNGTDTGFVGFLQPRFTDGSWDFQAPTRGSPADSENCCGMFSQDLATYEGSIWLYTFYAPGDGAKLVKMLGGDDMFVQRLDYMHENLLLDIGNEQSFLPVFQYHWAGRPGRSSYRARDYIPRLFNSTVIGMPGNDDSGAMGAFVVWSMIGLYPNAGQNVYLISTPFFPETHITSRVTGKVATILTHGLDKANHNIYIHKAKLNGRAWTRSWLDHSFFLDGGILELWVSENEPSGPQAWGSGSTDRPPSLSDLK